MERERVFNPGTTFTLNEPVNIGAVGLNASKRYGGNLAFYASESYNGTYFPQLEYGTTSTDYEPYTEQTYSITPPRPLNRLSSYDGTKSIALDYADIDSGHWHYETDMQELKDLAFTRDKQNNNQYDNYNKRYHFYDLHVF